LREIHLRAPATTANVGPGYDIFAIALEEPYDEIKLKLNDSGKIKIKLSGEKQDIPLNPNDNTAGIAIQELLKRKKIRQGIDLQIIKKMPSGCGLGTTGASASACVSGLNKILDLDISNNEMIDIARFGEVASGGFPHADNVAAALLGGFILVKSYDPINVLKLNIPEFPVVLAVIRKSQRTTRGFISYDIGESKLKEQIAHCSAVINSIYTRNIEEFGKAINMDYVAEPVRSAAIPNYYRIKDELLDYGAFGVNISGGGSSVFAICMENQINKIAQIMEKELSGNPNFIKIIKTKVSNLGVTEIS